MPEARTATHGAARTFVLVHGAWHGGWCWRRVADRLQARGHRVFAPTLTGLAERSHLLTRDITLATHASDIVNLVKWEELDGIVLVGHSYAGLVITEVAERIGPSITSIVYLDAFLAEAGDSLVGLAPAASRKRLEDAVAAGDIAVAPIPAAAFRVNENDRAWVDAKCTPHPAVTFSDKVSGAGARERIARKAYVRAASYPNSAFDAALAKAKSRPGWRTYEVPCGHDVMLDMPDELAEILLEAA